VGGCDMEGYPLRYAWFAVVSLYTTPKSYPLLSQENFLSVTCQCLDMKGTPSQYP
jgi:hypothetical protein